MNLTEQKLKSIWKNKKNVFSKKTDITERFDTLNSLIDEILRIENKITFEEKVVKIGDREIKYIGLDENGTSPTINFFGPSKDQMTVGEAYSGVKQMSEKFEQSSDISNKIGCVLGGFDFETNKMKDKYRIISNKITGTNDYIGTLTSQGQSRHPSSHFADNNYFFNIMNFIQECVDPSKDAFEKATMVLRYPSSHLNEEQKSLFWQKDDDADKRLEYEVQKAVLQFRFPPKFLWMWANKDKVIHPVGLMSFRNFLNTEYVRSILIGIDKEYTPETVTNMKFEEFVGAWEKISVKILEELKNDENDVKNILELSKLISIITTEETDIKNISDLVKVGNRAVILWGPPGTGKTYESMEVVKELL